jgi:hypothetical protein
VVHILDDGRRLYLASKGKLLVMPEGEANFWVQVSRQVHGIPIDEKVYSKDLRLYERRSCFLEQLIPFARVIKTMPERADVPVDPDAFIVGASRRRRSRARIDRRVTIATPLFSSFDDLPIYNSRSERARVRPQGPCSWLGSRI